MNKLWIGREKEGNLKDINTLFVGSSSITVEDITDVLKKHTDIKQVYFGAGGLTEINQDVVKAFVKKYPGMITTLEMKSDDIPLFSERLLRQVYLMITVEKAGFANLKKLDNEMYQIKLQTPNNHTFIGVGEICDIVDTKELKGTLYEGDIIIQ